MNSALALVLALGTSSAFAQKLSDCEFNAREAANIHVGDKWHARLADCKLAKNKKVHVCKVIGGYGEEMEGSKELKVVLSKNCKKVIGQPVITQEE